MLLPSVSVQCMRVREKEIYTDNVYLVSSLFYFLYNFHLIKICNVAQLMGNKALLIHHTQCISQQEIAIMLN